MPTIVFEPDFLDRVAALRMEGARRGTRAGSGALGAPRAAAGFDLAGHRPYGPGDDPRALDWAALARWDTPVVRRYRDVEPRVLTVIVDGSASMGFGEPSKGVLARRLAGALGSIALASGIDLRLAGEEAGSRDPRHWLAKLEKLGPAGAPHPRRFLDEGLGGGSREWIVLSDLYEASEWRRFLETVRRAGQPALVVAISSKEDREPPPAGSEVIDAETGETRAFEDADGEEFRSKRAEFLAAWRAFASRSGCEWLEAHAEESWESAALDALVLRRIAR